MRYRFVDRIVSLEAGSGIHCQYCWPENLAIFSDHFPKFPLVPGVLLTEMMGQAVALCLQHSYSEYGAAILVQIKNAGFRDWVHPGERLDIYGEVVSVQAKFARVKTQVKRDNKRVASAELLFSFVGKEKLGLPEIDPLLQAYYEHDAKQPG